MYSLPQTTFSSLPSEILRYPVSASTSCQLYTNSLPSSALLMTTTTMIVTWTDLSISFRHQSRAGHPVLPLHPHRGYESQLWHQLNAWNISLGAAVDGVVTGPEHAISTLVGGRGSLHQCAHPSHAALRCQPEGGTARTNQSAANKRSMVVGHKSGAWMRVTKREVLCLAISTQLGRSLLRTRCIGLGLGVFPFFPRPFAWQSDDDLLITW